MKEKANNGRIYCLVSAAVILGIYVIQRVLNIVTTPTKPYVIIQAIVFTVLVGIVYFIVVRSNEAFYGILTAMLGFRMMPPDISGLSDFSPDADIVYFIVKNAALVIFLFAIVRLYKGQEDEDKIELLPILCTLAVVPFANHIQDTVGYFLAGKTGTMLSAYFSAFVLYTAAMIVLLFVASGSNAKGALLICDFQLVALILNAGRKLAAIVINAMIYHNHISRSYYCWILIYAFFIAAFGYMRKKKKA